MKTTLKVIGITLVLLLLIGLAAVGWYIHTKQPVRSGDVHLENLQNPVTITFDDRGVPHIQAQNETDMYRALGYVHAQDRLFQMELMRRLAEGELAEVFGSDLLETDKLFRTLGIAHHAQEYVAKMDMHSPSSQALLAYLDGVNQYQDSHRPPIEFNVFHIPKRSFTPQDTVAISGYLAYSFAMSFKTEPAMTYIRDQLGADYLAVFDTQWSPMGVLEPPPPPADLSALPQSSHPNQSKHSNQFNHLALSKGDWQSLQHVATVSQQALALAGVAPFQGSNAWAIAGQRTASGKPLLAGDPHIGFSVPSVWYEAHLSAPGFDLYGNFLALTPHALLGHNQDFAWSLTMFENDDIDLIAEKVNPSNPKQVWHQGQWRDLEERTETIKVKGAASVKLNLRTSAHGPIINDAFPDTYGKTPIAMWWAFLQTENPLADAFYQLNRAKTRDLAREAVKKIHAPGLNVVWANAKGDIAWWAAAKLVQRPLGVNPMFILDASKGEADKLGFYNFSFNPQEENPLRGYIVSANNQPTAGSGLPVPGYYLPPDRVQRLDEKLREAEPKWDTEMSKQLQLDTCNGYAQRVLQLALPMLQSAVTDSNDKAFLEPLQKWDGCYSSDSVAATLFTQFTYELDKAVFEDELGEEQFAHLLGTPALDHALPRLLANPQSPWWDDVNTKEKETYSTTVQLAWTHTLAHLRNLYGTSLLDWSWGKTHTLTHVHPIGMQKPFHLLFNVGPFSVPGGHETPNNMSASMGPAPWAVRYGPSTRRIIDFGDPSAALGINPVGQSGVLFDKHYADQAQRYANGEYDPLYLNKADIQSHSEDVLHLLP